MAAVWVFDLIVLIAVGRISDRLQLRKPFALGGTLAAVLVTGYLAVLMGRSSVPAGQLMLTGALLGAALAVAFGPWMANYSEDAENVDPRLQCTAWGILRLRQQDHGGARAAGGTGGRGGHQLADLAVDLAGVPAAVRPGRVPVRRALAASG
jgi:hypothetical protein